MSIYSKYKLSDKAQSAGVPVVLGVTPDGKQEVIYVARSAAGNPKYSAAVRKHLDGKVRDGKPIVSDAEINAAMIEVFADAIVTGWDNISGEDGKPLEYSRDAVVKVLTDLPELFDELSRVSGDMSRYRADVADKAKKK